MPTSKGVVLSHRRTRSRRTEPVPVIPRQEYDRWRVVRLMGLARDVGMKISKAKARRLHKSRYPKRTGEAIYELRERGLDATKWRIEQYCREYGFGNEPGTKRKWCPMAIDVVGAHLLGQGALTADAKWRQQHGVTWAEEQDLLRKHRRSLKNKGVANG